MNISSITFLIFTVAVVLLHNFIPTKLKNPFLLLASYGFVFSWNWQFCIYLLIITIFQYYYGLVLYKTPKRGYIVLGVAVNLLVLAYFRSVNFLIPEVADYFSKIGFHIPLEGVVILAPIGVSYHILQNISYLVDIYRKQLTPSNNFINFALFLAYFPKILAGPIERARTFLPKLENLKPVDLDLLSRSVTLLLLGLIRKLVIADPLMKSIPDLIFVDPAHYSPIDLIGWLIIYSFVIYNDFAGYTSIIRGISGFLGIELSNNFAFPYFSRNFSEFWNRWHITLSHWLRDYVYFPVSRWLIQIFPNRRNLVNFIIPPIVTMFVSGLWHGLSWHMILWGSLHGIYQVVERFIAFNKPVIPPDQQPAFKQVFSNVFVFGLVLLAWVPFRMETNIAFIYWKSMFNFSNFAIEGKRLLLILPYIIILVVVEWLLYRHQDEIAFLKFPRHIRAFLTAAALIVIIIASATNSQTPFIYQGF